jgi:iron(II)-dependent oxidoreductase
MVLMTGGEYRLFGGTCRLCQPERLVHVDSLFFDRTEVTVREYGRFVAAGEAPAPWAAPPAPDLPVTGVMWHEADAYCRWRDPTTRLPDEGEWEAAARGTDGRPYPWGMRWEAARANADSPGRGLVSAGSLPQSAAPSGALDLSGNAWEWTATPGPAGQRGEPQYIIRGGAFDSPPEFATTFYRSALPGTVPGDRRLEYLGKTGFRCARPLH